MNAWWRWHALRREVQAWRAWAHVPPPNWACSRARLGGYLW